MSNSLVFLLFLSVLQVYASDYVPLTCSCGPQGTNNSDGYCESCYQQPPCKDIPYIITEAEDGPLFVQFVPDTPRYRSINNICYTYYYVSKEAGLRLLFISEVHNNGKNNVQLCLVGDVSGKLQFECFEGAEYGGDVSKSAIAATDEIIGQACGNISAVYRCYEFQNCNSDLIGFDYRYGASNAMKVPLECKVQLINVVNDPKYNFVGTNFIILPNTRPFQCITRFHGAKCNGADNVDGKNSRSYP